LRRKNCNTFVFKDNTAMVAKNSQLELNYHCRKDIKCKGSGFVRGLLATNQLIITA